MTRRANGEGSIWHRKDGRWVSATYANTNTGGRKRVHIYGRTRAEVREKLAQLEHELGRGVRVPVENWTVGQNFTHWLATVVKPNLAPKTHQGYELIIRRHIIPTIGNKKLRTLAVVDVRQLMQVLQQQGLGRRSVQYTHAVLRASLQNAMRDELVMRNVAKLVWIPAPQYDVGLGLSVDQARLLLYSSKNDRLHALYVLAVYLGLRRAELVGLRWEDIDLDLGVLSVNHTLQRVDGELRLLPPKTKTSKRTVPLPTPVVEALRLHLVTQARERLKTGPKWVDSGMVFTSGIGTPLDPDNLYHRWREVRQVLDDPLPRFHDLREVVPGLVEVEVAVPRLTPALR